MEMLKLGVSRVWDEDLGRFVSTDHGTVYSCGIEQVKADGVTAVGGIPGKVRAYDPSMPLPGR